ncbi:uncharacterized protein N7482_008355 [Penicillium canariense]|uniref:Beta-lactamase-related domain-containing protein n=1 Tax=Penicillium canariense TaxID=189055 RepID=A0A9W9LIX5_9EURO|nr:uncharacterized protein N7482_008355 [Penicillium canariense]KAJ5157255.1 hypothetical protein N7482_008355 [Penicillium canariense]
MHFSICSSFATSLAGLLFFGTYTSSTRIPLPSWTGCPVDGPLLPRPTNLGRSLHIQNATASLTQALNSAIQGKIKPGFEVHNTSFSVALVSPFDEEANDSIIWSYHHLGKNNVNGTKTLNEDSQYLIGSVSKVFSDLLLLQSDVNLSDPVTKYLSGLDSNGTLIKWNSITLSALSDHLAGIPSNLPSSFESYFLRPTYEQLGFPLVGNESYPDCGVAGLSHACNKQQLIQMMNSALPARLPYSQPVYSTLAFTLFSMALGEKTGKSYDELLNETIIIPLGLTNTGVSPGDSDRAVIPPLDEMSQGWGADYGLNSPGGGLYSSLRDLSILIGRILDYTIFPYPDMTRQWLKPQSMTSLPSNLVGRPWEIQRTDNLVPKNPHTVDIYAKSGGANGYVSQISVVDQYGVGFVVMTAGPRDATTASILNEAIISSLVPATDQETRAQAQMYTGNYKISTSTSSTATTQSNATVAIDLKIDGRTGLKIDSLTRNGSDILKGILKLWNEMIPQTGIFNPDFRLYPTAIENEAKGEDNVVFEDWRINFDIIPSDNAAMSDLPGQGKLSNLCSSWQMAAWLYYGGEALDRVVFKINHTEGRAIGVDIPFLRSAVLEKA